MAQLEARLAELDEEREELAKYRKVDKECRSLEYTIYDKDLHETRLNLEKVSKPPPIRGTFSTQASRQPVSYCNTVVSVDRPCFCPCRSNVVLAVTPLCSCIDLYYIV